MVKPYPSPSPSISSPPHQEVQQASLPQEVTGPTQILESHQSSMEENSPITLQSVSRIHCVPVSLTLEELREMTLQLYLKRQSAQQEL